jgi:hypothetical protein
MIRKETWIVLALFAAALAGLLLWQRYGQPAGAEETTTPEAATNLFDYPDEALQTVRLERLGDRVAEFRRAGGEWHIAEPPGLPGDSAALATALGQLQFVSGQKLENTPEMEAMGLSKPVYRLRLTLADGAEQTAYIGKMTPTGGGYYALGSDQQVYVVNSYSLDPILQLIDEPPLQPTATPADAYPEPEATP